MSIYRYQLDTIRPAMASHLEKSLESVPHVQSVGIEIGSSRVSVEHDGADSDKIIAVLREEGFEPRME
jgi:copper chaperone CopZ